jgi:hypothetical protein
VLNAGEWRGFNMVISDASATFFLRGVGAGRPTLARLPDGVTMVTSYDPNDPESPRVARYLSRFRAVEPRPGDWSPWLSILADRSAPAMEQINVSPRGGYGTVCSSLLSLAEGRAPEWLFADGPPDEAPFRGIGFG